MSEGEFNIGIFNNINYIYNCAKDWFTKLVGYDEQAKVDKTYTNPDTKLQAGIPVYVEPDTSSPVLLQEELTQNSSGLITPIQGTPIKIAPNSVARRPLTRQELDDALVKTTSTGTLQEDQSSDEETAGEKTAGEKTANEEKQWATGFISAASATNYSESYSESIAELSNALSMMDTTALSAALNDANIDISEFINRGKSTEACKIIARIMFDEQFGAARDIGSRGKGNEQQMKEIWGDNITRTAKSIGSPCYLCTGQLVAGGQAEMEHRMKCGDFYAIFAYIYSLYPKELAEWRYYVNKVADDTFKRNLKDYYDAINMSPIDEDKLNTMYDNIIKQFKEDNGIADANEDYVKFTKLLRAYLHEFAYAHHVCNQIKCDHDLGAINKNRQRNVGNYHNVVKQHLAGAQLSDYKPWTHMKINPDFSNAESPQIRSGLASTHLDELEDRIVNQMNLLRKFSEEIRVESGQTQNRMILRILTDALINMQNKTGPTDPSERIKEQATLLARGANFYNNDITDAAEFNKDFNPPDQGARNDRLLTLFTKRLPRFLERIEIILNNTNTYQGGPNTLEIIDKCLKSPNVPDLTRGLILLKLKRYIVILTEINNKVTTILPNPKEWTRVKTYLDTYLNKLNTLSKAERTTPFIPVGQRKTGAQSSNAATFASNAKITTGNKTPSAVASFRQQPAARQNTKMEVVEENAPNTAMLKRRRPESRKLTDAELKILEAKEKEERRQMVIQQNRARTERADDRVKEKIDGGRRQKVRKTRKLKRRPRKITQRAGQRKRTMKRKSRSRKNTRRRR